MEDQLNTQVLIVGAGPTGLMAANQLMRFGIDFIIVDKKSGPTIESRAILVTSRSLEIYQQMGLSDHVGSNGKKITMFNLFRNGKAAGKVEIGEVGKGLSDFTYMLAFEQFKNERLLSELLDKANKSVLWEHEYIRLLDYTDTVKAIVKNKEHELQINASYLIACDGASSPVRHELDFSFNGGTYTHKFFVADTIINWDHGFDKLIVAPGRKNFCALMPISETDSYRVIGTLPKKVSKQENITFNDIQAVVKKTLKTRIEFKVVNWFSIYKLHHRAVDHFQQGKVFLAGDSAHIHSPAGGQGMNTGLQDAYNLCWKLAMVLKNQAPERLLHTYNEERLPFAKWLLKFTDRGFTIMTSRNWFVKFARKFIILPLAALMLKKERWKKKVFPVVSQIGYSYWDGDLAIDSSDKDLKFRAGDRFPYFQEDNLHLKMNHPGFHYVHIGEEPMTEEQIAGVRKIFPGEIYFIEDQNTAKWKKHGVDGELTILVRPDNYIGLIADEPDLVQLDDYLYKVGLKNT
ncbi:MAG: FAD-dependent monooxygenase [Crocinitomicaceae bacterium]|nr:FAD-dependent monooxygenase [Crocinitomicaceae bacterium]